MKKKLISIIVAGVVAFSVTGFVTPAVEANAAESTIQSTQNQEAFAVSFSEASYAASQELKASYHGKALVGDSIRLVSKDNNKGVGSISYHYSIKNLSTNENVNLNNYYEGSSYLTWTPDKAGLYEVKVTAKDQAGHSAENTIRYSIDSRFTTNEVPNINRRVNEGGELQLDFERADYFNPTLNYYYTGIAKENDDIYIVANATGGIGKLTYKYTVSVYRGGPNDHVDTTSTYPVYNWRPTAGVFQVNVTVTDEAGHSASRGILYNISSK